MGTGTAEVAAAAGQGPAPRAGSKPARRDPELARILDLSVPVGATLAECQMSIESILVITVGAILEFDVPVDTELTLFVGNRPIGRGQAVKSGENFGVRVSKIDTVQGRIDAMRRA